jgi:lactate dehydrogenase-like 2-hydroxyacid dehydrogenase
MSDDRPVAMISHDQLHRLAKPLEGLGFRAVQRTALQDADLPAVKVILHAYERPLEPAFLATLPNLGLIACVSVGYDGVDVPWCRAHGIEVSHAHGLNAEDVADHGLGLLLGGWRRIVVGDAVVRDGAWRKDPRIAGFPPPLRGRKAGVVGLGHIGEAFARRVAACGMEVAWWGPRPKPAAWPRAASLLALAQASDILIVACRADASNRGLISREVIEAVGPAGMIVNVARGSVVDETALIAALKDGRLGSAGLDVFEQEPTPPERWADVPNVVLSPHIAGGSTESISQMTEQALENIRRHMAGAALMSPVTA